MQDQQRRSVASEVVQRELRVADRDEMHGAHLDESMIAVQA